METKVNTATRLWAEGNRRTVRQMCMDDDELFAKLESHLSAEDYATLSERIQLRTQA